MEKIAYKIKDELGIHARPAGLLAKEASTYHSRIMIGNGQKEVDAKKIIGIMSLGVKIGETINLTIEGSDEALATAKLKVFLEENL